jgi:hypothetical protein
LQIIGILRHLLASTKFRRGGILQKNGRFPPNFEIGTTPALARSSRHGGGSSKKGQGPKVMTMTTKTLSNSLTAALFAIAFSAAFLLSAVGPAINVVPAPIASQGQVA